MDIRNLSITKIKTFAFLSVITIAGLSTILRVNMESNITLIRVILPFLFIFMFVNQNKKMKSFLLISGSLFVYSILVSLYISRFQRFDIVFTFHYIIVIFLFFYSDYIIKYIGVIRVTHYLKRLLQILLLLAYIQYFLGGTYPNTQNRLPMINICFWNENEFSAILGGLTIIYFLIEKSYIKYLILIASLYLIHYSNARLTLMAVMLFITSLLVLQLKIFRIKYFGFITGTIIISSIILVCSEQIHIDEASLKEIIITPIERIINLEPVYNIGSVANRLNAIIYGTFELKKSYTLGIGPGNSIPMMIENIVPGTEKYTAFSMHNFIYQTITELGLFGLLLFYLLIKNIWIRTKKIRKNNFTLFFLFYFSLTMIITSLSGPHTNYFFIFIFYFSISLFNKYPNILMNYNYINSQNKE